MSDKLTIDEALPSVQEIQRACDVAYPQGAQIQDYIRVILTNLLEAERKRIREQVKKALCQWECVCIPAYKDRNMADPSCVFCEIESAVSEALEAITPTSKGGE